MVNEAALLAARRNRKAVGLTEFEVAREKTMWGAERRSLVMSDEERRVTAVHEAGHALVAMLSPGADPVHKCSIIPRGRALGLTWYLPHVERHTVSRTWCMTKLRTMLGGRAAESLVLSDITNGASNDIESATLLARRMVCEWGMSSRIGPVAVGGKNSEVFIGKELVKTDNLSEQSLQVVDSEVRRIVDEALLQARSILEKNHSTLDALTSALLEREVLDSDTIRRIVKTHEHLRDDGGSGPVVVERPAISRTSDAADDGVPAPPVRRNVEEEAEDEEPERRQPRRKASERREQEPEQTPESDDEEPQRRRPRRRAPEPQEAEREQPEPEEPESEPVDEPEEEPEEERESEPLTVGGVKPRVVEFTGAPKPTNIIYGRKAKRVRRHGLPSDEVPEHGVLVSSITSEEEVAYGRKLRPADETQAIRATPSVPKDEANADKPAENAEPGEAQQQADEQAAPAGAEQTRKRSVSALMRDKGKDRTAKVRAMRESKPRRRRPRKKQ